MCNDVQYMTVFMFYKSYNNERLLYQKLYLLSTCFNSRLLHIVALRLLTILCQCFQWERPAESQQHWATPASVYRGYHGGYHPWLPWQLSQCSTCHIIESKTCLKLRQLCHVLLYYGVIVTTDSTAALVHNMQNSWNIWHCIWFM